MVLVPRREGFTSSHLSALLLPFAMPRPEMPTTALLLMLAA